MLDINHGIPRWAPQETHMTQMNPTFAQIKPTWDPYRTQMKTPLDTTWGPHRTQMGPIRDHNIDTTWGPYKTQMGPR